MRSDLSLFVVSPDRLEDTFQHLGSRLGSTFIGGGIYPLISTRNFTLPLQNGHYLAVVCPLDHPSSDSTPFGKLFHNAQQKVAAGSHGLLQLMMFQRLKRV